MEFVVTNNFFSKYQLYHKINFSNNKIIQTKLLIETKLYILPWGIYNIRFQEKNLNLNRDTNLGTLDFFKSFKTIPWKKYIKVGMIFHIVKGQADVSHSSSGREMDGKKKTIRILPTLKQIVFYSHFPLISTKHVCVLPTKVQKQSARYKLQFFSCLVTCFYLYV